MQAVGAILSELFTLTPFVLGGEGVELALESVVVPRRHRRCRPGQPPPPSFSASFAPRRRQPLPPRAAAESFAQRWLHTVPPTPPQMLARAAATACRRPASPTLVRVGVLPLPRELGSY
jgi:hypothetical protein